MNKVKLGAKMTPEDCEAWKNANADIDRWFDEQIAKKQAAKKAQAAKKPAAKKPTKK